jgi:hypothetical protein
VASRHRIALVALSVAGGVIVLTVSGAAFFRKVVVMEVDDADRASLAVASDFVASPKGTETWSKRHTIDWGTKVTYDCKGLGRSARASVSGWRMDSPDPLRARVAYDGAAMGMRAGFAAAKRSNERIEEGPHVDAPADDVKAWTFYVDDKKAGSSALMRCGRHVWFVVVNGYVIEDWKMSQVVSRYARAVAALDGTDGVGSNVGVR